MNAYPMLAAEIEDDRIRTTAMDYIEGWYAGDAHRMERALHPDLVKRAYLPGPDGNANLLHVSALSLVQASGTVRNGSRTAEVTILDRFQGIACVRAAMTDWVDYMHVVKVGGDWKIINILGELTPEQWNARGGSPGARTR